MSGVKEIKSELSCIDVGFFHGSTGIGVECDRNEEKGSVTILFRNILHRKQKSWRSEESRTLVIDHGCHEMPLTRDSNGSTRLGRGWKRINKEVK